MKIVRQIKKSPVTVAIGSIIVTLIIPSIAYGLNPIQDGALAAQGSSQPANLFGPTGVFTIFTNSAMMLIGALSVIMIIIGGFRYVLSGGKTTSVTTAKNTVIYAIIGLIVALLSYAIINFVLVTMLPK